MFSRLKAEAFCLTAEVFSTNGSLHCMCVYYNTMAMWKDISNHLKERTVASSHSDTIFTQIEVFSTNIIYIFQKWKTIRVVFHQTKFRLQFLTKVQKSTSAKFHILQA